jgi:hypothetical protein
MKLFTKVQNVDLYIDQKNFLKFLPMCESFTLIKVMTNWWWFNEPLLNHKIQSPNKLLNLTRR